MKRENFEIYDNDIYELKTRVLSAKEKQDFLEVVLEKTPFRPSSGGQPSDNGFLENDYFKGFVLEVLDREFLIHKVKVEFGSLKNDDFVIARIDAERRKKLRMMHSGEHLFFGILKRLLEEQGSFLEAEKINLEEDEGNLFVKTEKLDFDILFKAEEIANNLIENGVDVLVHYSDKNNIDKQIKNGLRIKTERIEEDFVRIVEFKGIDISACTGTHVKNAKEIESFLITDFKNLGNERFVIKFKTGSEAKRAFVLQSRVLRLIEEYSGKNELEILDFLKKQISDKERFKEKYYNYFSDFLQRVCFENINGLEFCFLVFEDEDLKLLVKNASKLCTKKRVVCFLNRTECSNENKENIGSKIEDNCSYDVVAMSSKDINIDLKGFFESIITKEFPGKIGGNENYVTGRILCNEPKSIREMLLRILKQAQS
ncbi:MAG: alanine--tRNA ligase-related protein [Candidatus Woesearchaeota archaeon]